jgi:hypothetical protein
MKVTLYGKSWLFLLALSLSACGGSSSSPPASQGPVDTTEGGAEPLPGTSTETPTDAAPDSNIGYRSIDIASSVWRTIDLVQYFQSKDIPNISGYGNARFMSKDNSSEVDECVDAGVLRFSGTQKVDFLELGNFNFTVDAENCVYDDAHFPYAINGSEMMLDGRVVASGFAEYINNNTSVAHRGTVSFVDFTVQWVMSPITGEYERSLTYNGQFSYVKDDSGERFIINEPGLRLEFIDDSSLVGTQREEIIISSLELYQTRDDSIHELLMRMTTTRDNDELLVKLDKAPFSESEGRISIAESSSTPPASNVVFTTLYLDTEKDGRLGIVEVDMESDGIIDDDWEDSHYKESMLSWELNFIDVQ